MVDPEENRSHVPADYKPPTQGALCVFDNTPCGQWDRPDSAPDVPTDEEDWALEQEIRFAAADRSRDAALEARFADDFWAVYHGEDEIEGTPQNPDYRFEHLSEEPIG